MSWACYLLKSWISSSNCHPQVALCGQSGHPWPVSPPRPVRSWSQDDTFCPIWWGHPIFCSYDILMWRLTSTMIEVQFFRVGQILPGLSSLGQSWTYLVGPWHVHELNHIFILCKPCKTRMHSCGILCKTTVDVLPKTCVPTPYIRLVCSSLHCKLM